MNLIVQKEPDGTMVFEEFRNDHDAIECALQKNIQEINALYDAVVLEYSDDKWNAYIQKCIDTLKDQGWDIHYV